MNKLTGTGFQGATAAAVLLCFAASAALASSAVTDSADPAAPASTPAAASTPASTSATANASTPASASTPAVGSAPTAAAPAVPVESSATGAKPAGSHSALLAQSSAGETPAPPIAQAEPPQTTGQQTTQPNPPQPAAQQGTAPQASQLQQVIVTGSHISESTFTSPTPVTVIDSATIQSLGLVDVGDVVNLMPANSNFTSSANVGLGNFYIGAQFANLRGLDPFYGTRTLTLVDSERFVQTAAGGQVDLNVIPSIMISRVDTVTGGASAAYGSDAVAGVVNIILDSKFEGFKAQFDGGETTYDDGGDLHGAIEWGTAFADDRVHNVLAAEYEDAQGIGECGEVRPWCAQSYGEFTNTGYTTNGLPHYVIGPNATEYSPYTGMLAGFAGPGPSFPGASLGEFNSAGTALVPFTAGTFGSGAGPFTPTEGGSGPNYYDSVTIRPPVTHWSLYNRTSFDITDSLQASLDVSFEQRRATNVQGSDGPGGFPAAAIYSDNAYLPTSVAASCVPACWFYADTSNDLSLINTTQTNVGRVVLGLKGDLFAGWTWDGYYEWGETGTRERLANDVVENLQVSPALTGDFAEPAGTYDFFNWALNAVVNPANGQIVCAATLPGNPSYSPLAAGCVPLDLFGADKASPAALAYAFRTLQENAAFTQQVLSWSTHGTLFSGWGAGPVDAAVGAEYRHSMASVTHDLQNQPWYSQYLLSYGGDYSGDIDVVEGFGELDVPILKDLPFARNLGLNLAVRETENDSSNTYTGISTKYDFPSFKAGLVWDTTDWMRFRATRSRDTRAASFQELFSQTVASGGLFGTVENPWVNPPGSAEYGSPVDPAKVTAGGYAANVGLRPETADTTTLGIVLTPEGALDGLQLSADWYNIVLDDAISELGASNLINACYAGDTYYCQFISGTPNGTGGFSSITAVNNYNLNIGSYITRGFDYEVDYKLPISRFASGRTDSLDFRVLATYQYDQIISPGAGLPTYNYAGVSGPTAAFGDFNTEPKWQGNGFITYINGPLTSVLQVHYIGSGKYLEVDPNTGLPVLAPGDPGYSPTYAASINNNSVASATYFNLALTYTLPFWEGTNQKLQVFGSLDNIFNKYPPVAPGGNGYPTNPVYFDTYGRTWKMGVRVQF